MKAERDIPMVKVDGVKYSIKAGEVIPPSLMQYWTACNMVARMKAQGIIRDEMEVKAEVKPEVKGESKKEK